MKTVSALFGLVILVLVLCFALSNQQSVMVAMWPLPGSLQMPLYMVCLIPLLLGLSFGVLVGWVASLPHRLRARRLSKEVETLKDRVIQLERTVVVKAEPAANRFFFWKKRK